MRERGAPSPLSARTATPPDRAQLPTPAIEGAIAVLLVLGVTAGFALDVGSPDARERQLDAYASDAATILANEPPQHRGGTRLEEVTRDEEAFERERATLERRVGRVLPANLMYRVETPHGRIGYPKPDGVTTGSATVTTLHGEVTIRVWYA